jgi:hypothetical protein
MGRRDTNKYGEVEAEIMATSSAELKKGSLREGCSAARIILALIMGGDATYTRNLTLKGASHCKLTRLYII